LLNFKINDFGKLSSDPSHFSTFPKNICGRVPMLTLINFISLVADPDVDPEPIINDMSIIVGEEMEGFPKVTRR